MSLTRRGLLTGAAAIAAAPLSAPFVRAQTGIIRVGYSAALSGWGAGGATASTTPNYGLWAKRVNDAGGLKVGGVSRKIEMIAYDDRTEVETSIRNVERLVNQDKVDFILPPWGTGFNLAVGPILDAAGYPHLAVACVTDQAPRFIERWPRAFFLIGRSASGAVAFADLLAAQMGDGSRPKTVAMISVQDQFGIELARAMRPSLAAHGFEIVVSRAYPLGTQDLGPLVAEAKASRASVFVACSYPPDTIAIAEQARIQSYNPFVFYTAVGTAYPQYRGTFGAQAEGVLGSGGIDTTLPGVRDYIAAHTAFAGTAPDYWAAPVTYASLQMLGAAIERVGIDRGAVASELASGSFDTIIGRIQLKNRMRPTEWWVGQWQSGDFRAVGPVDAPGVVRPVLPKPDWT